LNVKQFPITFHYSFNFYFPDFQPVFSSFCFGHCQQAPQPLASSFSCSLNASSLANRETHQINQIFLVNPSLRFFSFSVRPTEQKTFFSPLLWPKGFNGQVKREKVAPKMALKCVIRGATRKGDQFWVGVK